MSNKQNDVFNEAVAESEADRSVIGNMSILDRPRVNAGHCKRCYQELNDLTRRFCFNCVLTWLSRRPIMFKKLK